MTDAEQEKQPKLSHGGSRPGAGRPTTGRKQVKFFLNDEEKEAVKKFIESMRAKTT